MDSRRGPPLIGGSHWPSTDMNYQPGSSSGNHSGLAKMDETGESSAGGQGMYSQNYGKGPESSRPPIHKPAQISSKLMIARSSGSRKMQRAQQGSLHEPWNVLQGVTGGLSHPGLESTVTGVEANIDMDLKRQLLSDEDALQAGQEQADSEYDLFWGRGGSSSIDFLAGRGPVAGNSSNEYFPTRTGGPAIESVGAWSGMPGVVPLGSRQVQTGAGVAYPGGSFGSNGIDERLLDDNGGSMSFNSLNPYRDQQDFQNGGRDDSNGRRADVASGSMAFNSLCADHPNYKDQANFQTSSSNYVNSAEMEAFWAVPSRHHATLDTHAACRTNGGHYGTDRHSLRSNVPEIASGNGSGIGSVSSARSSACKRKSCTPVVSGGSSSSSGTLHRGGFRESYGGRAVGGSSMSRRSTPIAGHISDSDVGTSSSAEATFMGLGDGPRVAHTVEDLPSQSSIFGIQTESLPEDLWGRGGRKSVLGSGSASGSSQRMTRGGPDGVVLMERGAVQPPFARTVRRAVPGLNPENWGSWRTPHTNSSMDGDDDTSTTNLLVDQMHTSTAPHLHGSPSVGGGLSGASASPQTSETTFGSTGVADRPRLRYMGNSVQSSSTHASTASQLRAAVAVERRLHNQGINYHNLESMSLSTPSTSNSVFPMMQTTSNSAVPSSSSPLRLPPHPSILRSRLQGGTARTLLPSLSTSGPGYSHLSHAVSFNPSVLASSGDSLPSFLQGSMLPRSSAPAVHERGFSSVAESLRGMPFGGLYMSAGDGAHQPQLVTEGLAEILLALERVERDEDLTYEQLVMLEATLLFGGMGLHDQHSDLRLDVDNMSYEELLALEERIGNVSTGVTAEVVDQKLKRSQYSSLDVVVAHFSEECDIKCSICQEEYVEGDELGKIDCGHGYHMLCIQQWLMQKNQCPICKATALS